MSVIAVSETLGSLGNDIGRAVARELSYDYADREILARAAERYGEGVMDLTHASEEKPSLLERFSDAQRRYRTYVEAAVLELAARDNVVLSGRGATILLGRVRHVLRVRVTAPADARARRVEEQHGMVREAALEFVHEHDRERAARVRFLYHVDWEDPLLYDLVINTARVPVETGVRLVRQTLESRQFAPTPESRQDLVDQSLTAQAKAALLANAATRSLPVYVSCRDAYVTVSGMVQDKADERAVLDVLGALPGSVGVLSEIVVVPRRGRLAGV